MGIRRPTTVAPARTRHDVEAAAHLFDQPPDLAATDRFLASETHHLLLAYADERPVGFVTGVEQTHPDKGSEMFLYELGVDEPARDQGVGRALVRALGELARERGCYGMYTLTEPDNEPAQRAYAAAGGRSAGPQVMLEWSFADDDTPG